MLYVIIYSLCKAKGKSFDENVSTPHRTLPYECVFLAVLSTVYPLFLLSSGGISFSLSRAGPWSGPGLELNDASASVDSMRREHLPPLIVHIT